ncbi:MULTISPECIES: DUF3427 domain-containing protein [unclassified Oceanispirochaeta]|uniref:DUF3427 domain-containing protein n=1 Tax=unclassified Oceanispirochaeta TaxID=2635722 RepID=UPI0014951C95|nr:MULTISPECIES: DUF3427 domain-containing protein [unclassified Oceanispirochaeta]
MKERHKNSKDIQSQIGFCNELLQFIDSQISLENIDDLQIHENAILTGILGKIGKTDKQLGHELKRKIPQSGLSVSTLFTGSNADISIDTEIEKDMLSSNRIYLLVSFIRWSGLVLFEKILREITQNDGVEVRVLTTTYMGATEARALEFLSELPNTKIRISYNTSHERLHAKSYIFERNNGLDTAYIGSSNISRSALTKGLEWNLRVTSQENPHIIEKAKATFEHYWNSTDFEDFEIGGIERFSKALEREKHSKREEELQSYIQISPFPFQKEVLEKLHVERIDHGYFRNLVVSATGTGKTVISAFDFKRLFQSQKEKASLLFIAHREEILLQARGIFRSVLGAEYHDFGRLWVGKHKPGNGNLEHLFMSIQTFNSQKKFFQDRIGSDFFDFIIIDEAHHSKADTYRVLIEKYKPKVLLGLTATPERMDGNSLLPDFCNKIAAEIRLPDAMKLKLLSPFQYFCISDESVDLRSVPWVRGAYKQEELGNTLSVKARVYRILDALKYYLNDPGSVKALCFCVTKSHADFMAKELRKVGLKAVSLTSNDNDNERKDYQRKLRNGEINYLCVVDIFNEGIDIPEIDTVLFLRPTESLTVYLQQLGRGLRLSDNKECLTVLDFVSQVHEQYNFSEKFRALIGKTSHRIEDEIEKGFPHLPSGCTIRMEEQAEEFILENIKKSVFNAKRLRNEISLFYNSTGQDLTIHNFISYHKLDMRILYANRNSWEILKVPKGKVDDVVSPEELILLRSLRSLVHVDSIEYLNFIQDLIINDFNVDGIKNVSVYLLVFYFDIWKKPLNKTGFSTTSDAIAALNKYKLFKNELSELVLAMKERVDHIVEPILETKIPGLFVHAHYTRDQLLALAGQHTPEKMYSWREGTLHLSRCSCSLMMVTLNKSEKDFSPSIQYEDYAVSETLFHWQSQNATRESSETGQRYINHQKIGWDMLLFARETKKDSFGLTDTYWLLGKVNYISHKGERPMSINWQLEKAIPPVLWQSAAKMAVG